MARHLIPTVEAFAADVAEKYGPDAVLHHSNRITACGRHGGSLSTTTVVDLVTCKVCAKRSSS